MIGTIQNLHTKKCNTLQRSKMNLKRQTQNFTYKQKMTKAASKMDEKQLKTYLEEETKSENKRNGTN